MFRPKHRKGRNPKCQNRNRNRPKFSAETEPKQFRFDHYYEEAIEAIEFFMDDDDDDNYVDAAENLGANEDGMDDDDDGKMARWLVSQFQ